MAEVETIAEYLANIKFVGLEPEPDTPGGATAYMIAQGVDVEVGIPTGPAGPPGEPGQIAPALRWQTPVSDISELPIYLTADDSGKAWIVGGSTLHVWSGTEFVMIADVLIPGPTGPRGLQGLRGERGLQGNPGPTGPSAAIESASDYSAARASEIGDILVKNADGWGPGSGTTKTMIIGGGSMNHASVPILGKNNHTLLSIALPSLSVPYLIEVDGGIICDHGLTSRVEIQGIIGASVDSGIRIATGWGRQGGTGPHHVSVQPDTNGILSSDTSPGTPGIFPADTPQQLHIVARRQGGIDGWSTQAAGSSIRVRMSPL